MQLNQTTLRGILAEILSVDQNHVVPKQGNWWNPQQKGADIENWCAYRIKRSVPKTPPFYAELSEGVGSVAVLKVSVVELQFVGPLAEQLAQSVAMWALRGDVKEALAAVRGAIMYENLEAVPSDFYQEGANTVIAWNVPELKIMWFDTVETNQKPIMTIDIGGKIN